MMLIGLVAQILASPPQTMQCSWVIILSLCHLIKRQLIVSRSSVEAEYRVFANVVAELYLAHAVTPAAC